MVCTRAYSRSISMVRKSHLRSEKRRFLMHYESSVASWRRFNSAKKITTCSTPYRKFYYLYALKNRNFRFLKETQKGSLTKSLLCQRRDLGRNVNIKLPTQWVTWAMNNFLASYRNAVNCTSYAVVASCATNTPPHYSIF